MAEAEQVERVQEALMAEMERVMEQQIGVLTNADQSLRVVEATVAGMAEGVGATEVDVHARFAWLCGFPLEPFDEDSPDPRRCCDWEERPDRSPLAWIKLRLFGHPGRCPLHGIKPTQIITTEMQAQFPPRPGGLVAMVVVK